MYHNNFRSIALKCFVTFVLHSTEGVTVMESCSIGVYCSQQHECHKLIYTRTIRLRNISELSADERTLLLRRSGFSNLCSSTSTVCSYHEQIFLAQYSFLERSCCDPCNLHPGSIRKKSLRVVDTQAADAINQLFRSHVNPGQKLCPSCRKYTRTHVESAEEDNESDEVMDLHDIVAESSRSDAHVVSNLVDQAQTTVNTSLTSAGFSPMKEKVSSRDKVKYGKRKATEVKEAAVSQLATVLRVQRDDIDRPPQEDCIKCADMQQLIADLKQKLTVTDSKEKKIKILTLAPQSWTVQRTTSEFAVSEYMVKKARSIRKEFGILPDEFPAKKGSRELPRATVEQVIGFYQSDEYSRMCPGKKEFVSVKIEGQRVQQQKRLLLINLKEMYELFKQKESDHKIGFSKFCELRPRWCVTVASSGAHSVCVCAIHQNVKLLVSCLHHLSIKDYKQLMSIMVCDVTSRNCMIHQCEECPGKEALRIHIMSLFASVEMDEEDIISFKQWATSDHGVSIVTRSETVAIFVDELCRQMETLTTHDFIAKAQSAFLSSCKANLPEDTALVLLDFAENYSFIVQDAIQGHHWNNSQATLHPFAIYHQPKDGKLQCLSVCVVSDCMQHDSITVHVFIGVVLKYIKQCYPYIKTIKYFSDGAASQYKNFKNFSNLMHHQEDFNGLSAEWHFFATSHGKSPCDGIGGTVKRLVARTSLQAANSNHILTPEQLFEWAAVNITGIKFFFVPNSDIQLKTTDQELRFTDAKKVGRCSVLHTALPLF